MRKGILIAAIALLSLQPAFAKEYVLDSAHSAANFKIKHIMSKVGGQFQQFVGAFSFDETNPKAFKGEFTVQSASINTNNADRDKHLRAADFFNAEKFPTLTFKSKELKGSGGKFQLVGDFTMLGKTKPVTFDVEYLGAGKEPWGNEKVGFSATGKISRKDFGMVWNKVLDTGGLLLSDDVEIEILVEGNAKK